MVRVGENGQSDPLPGKPSFELCPCMPDGAERSLMGPSNSAQTARRFRDALPPHLRPALALEGRWRGFPF